MHEYSDALYPTKGEGEGREEGGAKQGGRLNRKRGRDKE